jgi:calcium-dependent protein kinase
MEDMDSNGSGSIDYTEFLAATLDKKLYSDEEVCWSAFRVFDRNGDGKISADELRQMLSADRLGDLDDLKCIDDIIVEIDGNGDGMIDFTEFMHMMRKDQSPAHNARYVSVKSQ